jgi:hypothetical protein
MGCGFMVYGLNVVYVDEVPAKELANEVEQVEIFI